MYGMSYKLYKTSSDFCPKNGFLLQRTDWTTLSVIRIRNRFSWYTTLVILMRKQGHWVKSPTLGNLITNYHPYWTQIWNASILNGILGQLENCPARSSNSSCDEVYSEGHALFRLQRAAFIQMAKYSKKLINITQMYVQSYFFLLKTGC